MSIKQQELEDVGIEDDIILKLILFNSAHFWDDVVNQIEKATGFDRLHCEQIAMLAHTTGKAVVKSGSYQELSAIDAILKEIDLRTEIQ